VADKTKASFIPPMLLTRTEKLPEGADWLYELKLDPTTVVLPCASPSGNAGDIVYNGDYHTYQYCNGAQWISLKGERK
jgi:hypothetical protein